WQPGRLKMGILPFDSVDFSAVLDALADAGFVSRYVAKGNEYGVIPTFTKHQHFHHREAPSVIPAPPKALEHNNVESQPRASLGLAPVKPLPSPTASTSASTSTSTSTSPLQGEVEQQEDL